MEQHSHVALHNAVVEVPCIPVHATLTSTTASYNELDNLTIESQTVLSADNSSLPPSPNSTSAGSENVVPSTGKSPAKGTRVVTVDRAINAKLEGEIEHLREWVSEEEMQRVRGVQDKLRCVHMPSPYEDHVANQRLIAQCMVGSTPEGEEFNNFYMVDLGRIVLQMARWRRNFPRVRPYYAVKCNPSSYILEVLGALGAGFDCASVGEFRQVMDLGVAEAKDIIFANPCKQVRHIQNARDAQIAHVTFDNEEELRKLAVHWPGAQCLLRIITNDSASVCQFSTKFGAPIPTIVPLLRTAKELGLSVVGVSFHVGSGCGDAQAFVEAARNARFAFDEGQKLGFKMEMLDIGGGFPGDDHSTPTFEDIADVLRPFLDEHFPDTRIIAEPGRYFACACHTLVMNVFSKRVIEFSTQSGAKQREYQYYATDGVYQSFNCIFFDHAHPRVYPMEDTHTEEHLTTIFGPTCDALDCIMKRVPYPELQVGDWLVVPDFGAYTVAAASPFNGFTTTRFEFISCLPVAETEP